MNLNTKAPDGLSSARAPLRLNISHLEQLESIVVRLDQLSVKIDERPVSNRQKTILNPLYRADELIYSEPEEIEDIIIGVVRAMRADYVGTHRGEEVNVRNVCNIVAHMEVVTSRAISEYLGLSDRQARKYLVAVEHSVPFLEKYVEQYIQENI